jgi:hypothetical protein
MMLFLTILLQCFTGLLPRKRPGFAIAMAPTAIAAEPAHPARRRVSQAPPIARGVGGASSKI